MTCWASNYSRLKRRAYRQPDSPEDQKAMEELLTALTSERAMSADALSTLLMQDFHGSKVATRLTVDQHEIEVQQANGLWTVVKPEDIAFLNKQPAQPLALPVSTSEKGGVLDGVLHQATVLHDLHAVHEQGKRRPPQQAR